MKKESIIVGIVMLLIGFGGGYFYRGKSQPQFGNGFGTGMMRNGNDRQFRQFNGNGNNGGNRMMLGRGVMGEVTSMDDKSMTVKMEDGSSKIVILSENTNYNQSLGAKRDDVKVGTKVAVAGNENSDGSVTAQNIQINPLLRNNVISPFIQKQ